MQATSISTHSSWKKELCTAHSPVRYPDLNDRQIMTACPPSTLDVQNTTWIQSCSIIALKPIKMSDIEMICKSLPSATNPTKFVEFFKTHTPYAQLSGPDYKAILLRVLDSDVTETILIEKCPALSLDNDKVEGKGVPRSPNTHFWINPNNVSNFFEQLKHFLESIVGSRQDLSHAANTKHGKNGVTICFCHKV